MTNEEALQFVREHQPMLPTGIVDEELLRQFDEVRKYFTQNYDERCVPLLLNAFGEGGGYGVCQLVEDTILIYPEEIVISALKRSLANSQDLVQYWSAQIAANYSSTELLPPLCELLSIADGDIQVAAITALESIGSQEALNILKRVQSNEYLTTESRELIREMLQD
jgi:hypothetical protein